MLTLIPLIYLLSVCLPFTIADPLKDVFECQSRYPNADKSTLFMGTNRLQTTVELGQCGFCDLQADGDYVMGVDDITFGSSSSNTRTASCGMCYKATNLSNQKSFVGVIGDRIYQNDGSKGNQADLPYKTFMNILKNDNDLDNLCIKMERVACTNEIIARIGSSGQNYGGFGNPDCTKKN